MAKPDTDDGWKRFAHELFSALCFAGFTGREWVVLHEVFEQIYGPALLRVFTLSPAEIAASAGADRHNISLAIQSLVDDKVLLCVSKRPKSRTYRFNKDYETWRKGKARRFTEGCLCVIRDAPKRAKIYARGAGAKGIKNDTSEGIKNDTLRYQKRYHKVSKTIPSIKDEARPSSGEGRRKKEDASSPPTLPEKTHQPPVVSCALSVDDWPVTAGPPSPFVAAVAEITKRAEPKNPEGNT